jgi:hypothetical protein
MADIMKDDVRTYVEELIKREFSTKSKEEKVLLGRRKADAGEHRNVQRRPNIAIISNGRTASDLGE